MHDEKMYDLAKLICSFINPHAAESHFSAKIEVVENSGFLDDLRNIDPQIDVSKYQELLD